MINLKNLIKFTFIILKNKRRRKKSIIILETDSIILPPGLETLSLFAFCGMFCYGLLPLKSYIAVENDMNSCIFV